MFWGYRSLRLGCNDPGRLKIGAAAKIVHCPPLFFKTTCASSDILESKEAPKLCICSFHLFPRPDLSIVSSYYLDLTLVS